MVVHSVIRYDSNNRRKLNITVRAPDRAIIIFAYIESSLYETEPKDTNQRAHFECFDLVGITLQKGLENDTASENLL